MNTLRRLSRLWAGATVLALLAACTDGTGPMTGPDESSPSPEIGPDDPSSVRGQTLRGLPPLSADIQSLSDGIEPGPQTITFDDASKPGDTEAPEEFQEGDFVVTGFWFFGGPLFAPTHLHTFIPGDPPTIFDFEAHHGQGTTQRQGLVIRRADGGPFKLLSMDYRSVCSNPDPGPGGEETPLEFGTEAPTAQTGLSKFTEVPVSSTGTSFAFIDLTGIGFDNVTELWITQEGCGDWDNVVVEPVLPFIEVEIDIKPGSEENPINLKDRGLVPVALLTTSTDAGESVDFDAADANPASLTLGNDDGDDTPVAARKNGTLMAEPEDVDEDGDLDLILHFRTQDLVENGDLDEETEELFLNGETLDGTPLVGSDVVTIPPGSTKGGGPSDG